MRLKSSGDLPVLLLLGGSLILFISLGIRHGFGLFLDPMSREFGWGREVFATAIALQNLCWGLVQPFTGALADRLGPRRVVAGGALGYALGLIWMGQADSPLQLSLSAGVLIGLSLSATSFVVILSAIGRAVASEQRSMAMGLASAAGSLGQFVMLPGSLSLINGYGWADALWLLGLLALIMIPCTRFLGPRGASTSPPPVTHPWRAALRTACSHRDFWMLSLGFFVCGFQVVFIGIHLPPYLLDQQLSAEVGTRVLALVGLFNVAGTYLAGWLGGQLSKPKLLVALYLARAVVIGLFLLFPVTSTSASLFGMAMGLLWLSTVPLTNGTVASLFGVGNLTLLCGVVFLFHQLGSFFGGWLGGHIYDQTGSYALVWQLSILLSLAAALCNLLVREQPVGGLVLRP